MANLTLPPEIPDQQPVMKPDGTQLTTPGGTPGNQGPQGWSQTDKAAHDAMWKLGIKSPMALSVLHYMISKLARGTSGVIISAPAIARAMGISERSVKTAVGILRESRFLQILKSGNTNAYIINSRVAWQGKRGMRYASFNAQILIDEQEQQKSVEELLEENGELFDVPLMELQDMVRIDAPVDVDAKPAAAGRTAEFDFDGQGGVPVGELENE